jgi:hypothetical protein
MVWRLHLMMSIEAPSLDLSRVGTSDDRDG